ncbi:probable cobyrinic acid a, c-diamide synthase (cbiA) [Thermoplasma acidophilum]|uniref:Cobyrinate a,c-diamide synthase n=1 Tax=Thermoplasma acidophilum (strain ATCC 25905 / DSM 1728 / JCM 9062 / NBRC 15155 / AMRC-C165) TaxID=273075 RepID=CBIA_THEAC|nr:cobyrinate a,c-diamide synthase [Thermoplasma acidophilum]Q9HIX6.1 RecName: Full=Cobyrinate a,c-diamide synthase; AltName: Full=Cobyrinic acid a,c-diamide synthetase [Thermoplasma acidophilum DSM 1728]MCY0852157.1 cobyrinate a,c-diamide synthase [Thermoplasma acidophilum]CAC12325.1 probable cobyrinic acid a, c-diamide synthase (cbiA) [Thermoplasma acidophilum]
MKVPRLIVAGTESGAGKTTITISIILKLLANQMKVKPYKIGPDYIDPQFHRLASGVPSENLDLWMMNDDQIRYLLIEGSREFDISVIEGVMGLFDGAGSDFTGSTYDLARRTGTPIVLVIDGYGISATAAAIVSGIKAYAGELLRGVIVTRVSGESHYRLIRDAVEEKTGVPVLGYMIRNEKAVLESRHLGLVQAYEIDEIREIFGAIDSSTVIDMHQIIDIARSADKLETLYSPEIERLGTFKVSVAMDSAFDFYYEENLRMLKRMGASIRYFSPMGNEVPDADSDLIYLGGGYPEVFAGKLQSATDTIEAIRHAASIGTGVYAECGGYMFLCRSLESTDGHIYGGVGIIPASVYMDASLVIGYREISAKRDTSILRAGETARGHEFHKSRIRFDGPYDHPFVLKSRSSSFEDGFSSGSVTATYAHIHFLSNPRVAENLLIA